MYLSAKTSDHFLESLTVNCCYVCRALVLFALVASARERKIHKVKRFASFFSGERVAASPERFDQRGADGDGRREESRPTGARGAARRRRRRRRRLQHLQQFFVQFELVNVEFFVVVVFLNEQQRRRRGAGSRRTTGWWSSLISLLSF